mmetsp:Transcript_12607/g.20842  ORF Transcript_12607/g.20842 Transcript_12607/m.20842 type:complete len:581 (-) Transcript_12607:179-1921(-)
MVASPKLFAGLSGCAALLFFSPSQPPSEMLDIASQIDAKRVEKSQSAHLEQSGWNAFGSSMHFVQHQLGGKSEHQDHGSVHSAQLRGSPQISQQSQQHRVNISCAVGVAVCLFFCCWLVAWAWRGAQTGLLAVHIIREVFDALLALAFFLPSLQAFFAEMVAASLISIAGLVALFGHLSCSPRQWVKSFKASLFIGIGMGLALPHFWIEMRDFLPLQIFGIFAAILVHLVPVGALDIDWSPFARHAKRLWNISATCSCKWLVLCSRLLMRQCSCRRARGSASDAHAKDRGIRRTGASIGRDAECRSSHHVPTTSRRGAIAGAFKGISGAQQRSQSHNHVTHVIDTSVQKPTAAPSAQSGGRRSSRAPAPPKQRSSGSLPLPPPEARKENVSTEPKKQSHVCDMQKENLPLEAKKEHILMESQKARLNIAAQNKGGLSSQTSRRQSLPGLAAAVKGAGIAPVTTSSFPIFVDDEFADLVGSGVAASAEPLDILAVTEGHQATVETLSARLASLRAFKSHWSAGNTSKALPEMHAKSNRWATRDIDKIRLILEDASPPAEQAKAASLSTMRVGVQTILASNH